jgi:predicted RNA binding protein YcfA (HicA-like mRNA interferase family)
MTNAEKRLQKMQANPKDWRIEDLQTIADSIGIEYRSAGGSHVVFRCAECCHVTVPAKRPIKPVYIKQFIELVVIAKEQRENENNTTE